MLRPQQLKKVIPFSELIGCQMLADPVTMVMYDHILLHLQLPNQDQSINYRATKVTCRILPGERLMTPTAAKGLSRHYTNQHVPLLALIVVDAQQISNPKVKYFTFIQ